MVLSAPPLLTTQSPTITNNTSTTLPSPHTTTPPSTTLPPPYTTSVLPPDELERERERLAEVARRSSHELINSINNMEWWYVVLTSPSLSSLFSCVYCLSFTLSILDIQSSHHPILCILSLLPTPLLPLSLPLFFSSSLLLFSSLLLLFSSSLLFSFLTFCSATPMRRVG